MTHFPTSTLPQSTRVLLVGLLLILPAACSIFEAEEEVADEARVVVTGSTPQPLELVTSTKFTRTFLESGGVGISLAFADTAFLSLDQPHDQIYPIKPDRGFLVRLKNPGLEPAVVSMQVFFDGELAYNHQNITLQEAALEFSYVFENQNVIR
jgi:hypothetical protein